MKELKKNSTKFWYNESLLTDPVEQVFEPDYWQAQDRIIGSAQGRGTTWFVRMDTCDAALRHYRRGGLFGRLVKDYYWFTGWKNTRSYKEYALLNTLAKAGVNVPRPIAIRTVRSGCFYRADLLSEKVKDAEDLVSFLSKRTISKQLCRSIGYEIKKMHQINVNHTDLNIHNILIDNTNKVWLIDFDKCHKSNDHGWKQENMNRLERSFRKEKGRVAALKDMNVENIFGDIQIGYNEQK
ncbi:3-deoxy-D-manno-octulosonic acid kinase [Vibrio maritimus]|uniref:3-deoxy-D-manno-octulosonic acid kinase n=1 Tax=Vibrio maritimus TaxID=990268 RepID=UPI001F19E516|nr:3-deoxy-D-manno-octulosonic acid kinase [Vibrio maritimus]